MRKHWHHGTRSGYVHGGCRCEPCTLANRTYQREYMKRYYGTERYRQQVKERWHRYHERKATV